ncbi:Replication protein A 70 kDa DNA-binding subunit [Monocercomonoides exilis]|uniref:Replication protein A 70 kDa DNA-binding subunit n=1 Tax=Monocercomonoides exilis TaxID=2049356 RepID=UPI00355AA1B0|nr:Replication protein A 70 kDa DNA-binding subunit [Monocercomonoides exilis]|eukprot:MONOS_1039.1-p1 / transcript=MONOS_1039.1 / gene=MONOS_1039 / organism=Monocercomonoides_exilis_PA203 / gene_product=Replication protein A 70 kDa DNA-binding subunit / transcript_product=Replication protein A 70 kDa DNA-binding subunit / location=Mono_scaffold00017:192591-194823(+) / protein_length=477 / sequence_SO=supercontig / SO=protein_coding / is_pseudo=false
MLSPTRKLLKSPSLSSQRSESGSQSNVDGFSILPISAISTYTPRNWAIKGRCSFIQPIRNYKGKDGNPGKCGSVDVMDESGSIRLTMFNQQVDTHYAKFIVGNAYIISKGNIKQGNKMFCKSDYEITATQDTIVQETAIDDSMPDRSQSFIQSLSHLSNHRLTGNPVDIIGIALKIEEPSTVNVKKDTQRSLTKRIITLCDDSMCEIDVTLWNERAEEFSGKEGDVICVENGKVGDYQGFRVISTGSQSQIDVNPTGLSRAEELKKWMSTLNVGRDAFSKIEGTAPKGEKGESRPVINVSAEQLLASDLGHDEKQSDFISFTGCITKYKRSSLWYLACPKTNCYKKLASPDEEQCSCGHNFLRDGPPKNRFILSLMISDSTGAFWVSCFNDVAEQLLQHNADEVAALVDENPNAIDDLFAPVLLKQFYFRIRARKQTSTINDEMRIQYTVSHMSPSNHVTRSKELLSIVKRYGYEV